MDLLAEQTESEIFTYIYSILEIEGRQGAAMDEAVEAGRTWRNVMEYIHEHEKNSYRSLLEDERPRLAEVYIAIKSS